MTGAPFPTLFYRERMPWNAKKQSILPSENSYSEDKVNCRYSVKKDERSFIQICH